MQNRFKWFTPQNFCLRGDGRSPRLLRKSSLGPPQREAAGHAGDVPATVPASRCPTKPLARQAKPPSCLMPRHTDAPNFYVFSPPGCTRRRVLSHSIPLDESSLLRCVQPSLDPQTLPIHWNRCLISSCRFPLFRQGKLNARWATRHEDPSTGAASLQATPSTEFASVQRSREVFQDLILLSLRFCLFMVRGSVREPPLGGLVHGVDA